MIWFGAAYYPEHRDPGKWDYDLDNMAAAGVNALRVGEFGWKRFEPSRDRYDFAWMDDFGQRADKRGIGLLVCPPLRTAPIWMVEQDRSMLIVDGEGRRLEFGSRYTFCINHPLLIERGMKLAARMARHFESRPWVLGWHLDNEYGDEPDCHCPLCTVAWRDWLRRRYPDVATLNRAWGNVFWGLEYDDFSQVPTPRWTKTAHQPAQILNWRRFRSDCTVATVALHARTLRDNGVRRPVTTNNQTWNPRTDYFDMARHLDVCGTNYYPAYGEQCRALELGLASVRGYKRANFQVHELRSGTHTISGESGNAPAPGEVTRLTVHTIAHGADAVFYFRWRNCPFGCEQHHGAITDYDGRPTRIYREVAGIGQRLRRLAPVLEGSRVVSQVALLLDFQTRWTMETGVRWNGPAGLYMQRCRQVYAQLRAEGVNVDVTGRECDFKPYRLLVVPLVAAMDDDLARKLSDYVRQGGVLVWHPLCGMRDNEAACFPDRIHPELKSLFGVAIEDFISTPDASPVALAWEGPPCGATGLIDLLKIEQPDVVTVAVFDGGNWFGAAPAIVERRVGQGTAVYVAGSLDQAGAEYLWNRIMEQARIERLLPDRPPPEIDVTQRVRDDGRRLLFLLNCSGQSRTLKLAGRAVVRDCWNDVMTDGKAICLPPHGCAVLDLGPCA